MATDKPNKANIPLNGRLITADDPAAIGDNFQSQKNMRYTDTHPKAIGGMTKINTTAIPTYPLIRNGYHFKKDRPSESHVLVQSYKSDKSVSVVLENTATIPAQGDFSAAVLWTDTTGAGRGYFSEAPGGGVAYCNGVEACIWQGNESPVGGFINYDPSGTFSYDFTSQVQNTLTDAQNVATLSAVSPGIDANTMLMLHLDNNVTDSSPVTPHTVTNTNATFDGTEKVFGTHSAHLDGATAYLSIPDDADFDFSGGIFTIDGRYRFDDLAANRELHYQETVVKKITFNTGKHAPVVGEIVHGNTSTATGVVMAVEVTSGAWATNDAAGNLYLSTITDTWQNAELIHDPTSTEVATTTSTAASTTNDYFRIYVTTTGAVTLEISSPYATGLTLTTAAGVITAATWYHVAITENGNDFYIFVGGSQKAYVSSAIRAKNYTDLVYIGWAKGATYHKGHIDELRVSNSIRWTSAFELPAAAYSAGANSQYCYLGTTRPIKGFKLYIQTANTTAGTMSVEYWNGTAWAAVTTLVDGTSAGGKTLAQTGAVTFSSTVSAAQVKIINGIVLYWYRVYFSAADAGASISQVTVDAPFQKIKDRWDGISRKAASFQYYKNSTFNDYTQNIQREDSYYASDASTYIQLGSMNYTTDYFVVGFAERIMGVDFNLVGGSVNTAASTLLSVSYWNGTAWVSVGTIEDGTIEGAKSFAKTGMVTWSPPAKNLEFTKEISKEIPLYYYKFQFSATLSADVRLFYLDAIPAQNDLRGYKFPLAAFDRLMLCCNMDGKKNSLIHTATGTTDIFNGTDSLTVEFGDDNELTCGCNLFSQFGSSLYNIVMIFKAGQTWAMVWDTVNSTWQKFLVSASKTVGCPAPLTLKTVSLPVEAAAGMNRNIAIWQGADGIYVSDGRSPVPASGDIANYFEKTKAECIKASMIGESVGWIDQEKLEYHWKFASGTAATTLNKEWVFDLKRWRWYEAERGANSLQCGFSVSDSYDNHYCYGTLDTGYMERLENGTDFDGVDIACELWTGDNPLVKGDFLMRARPTSFALVAKAKTTTANSITVEGYGDGKTTSYRSKTISPKKTDHRIINTVEKFTPSGANDGNVFHSFKLSMTTDDETCGFEPLAFGVFYEVVKEQDTPHT